MDEAIELEENASFEKETKNVHPNWHVAGVSEENARDGKETVTENGSTDIAKGSETNVNDVSETEDKNCNKEAENRSETAVDGKKESMHWDNNIEIPSRSVIEMHAEKEAEGKDGNIQMHRAHAAEICKDLIVQVNRLSLQPNKQKTVLRISPANLPSQRKTRPKVKRDYRKFTCGCKLCNTNKQNTKKAGNIVDNASIKSGMSSEESTKSVDTTSNAEESMSQTDMSIFSVDENSRSDMSEAEEQEKQTEDEEAEKKSKAEEAEKQSKAEEKEKKTQARKISVQSKKIRNPDEKQNVNRKWKKGQQYLVDTDTKEISSLENELWNEHDPLNKKCNRPPCDKDHFLFCAKCNGVFHGECPYDGPETWKKDKVFNENCGQTRARATLPDELYLDKSSIPGAGTGVFAKTVIEERVRFGPYVGESVIDDLIESGYQWEIISQQRVSHYVDAEDETTSNWMRFINCARTEPEQNLIAIQYCSQIYYRTYKRIYPGQELLVWYGNQFAKSLGLVDSATDNPKNKNSLSAIRRICMRCFKVLDSSSRLSIHEKSSCLGVRPKCHTCGMLFKNEDFLAKHLSLHENDDGKKHCNAFSIFSQSLCLINGCYEEFADTESLEKHLQLVHELERLTCKQCKKKFRETFKLQSHILQKHEGLLPWRCTECQKTFKFFCQLVRHLPKHTGLTENVCHDCQIVFCSNRTLLKHRAVCKRHQFPYACFRCRKAFSSQHDAAHHIYKECKYRFEDPKGDVSKHGRGSYFCDYPNCSVSTASLKAKNRHYLITHVKNRETRKLLSKNVGGRSVANRYYCKYCKISSGTAKADFYHQRKHGKEMRCTYCNEICDTYVDFVRHKKHCKLTLKAESVEDIAREWHESDLPTVQTSSNCLVSDGSEEQLSITDDFAESFKDNSDPSSSPQSQKMDSLFGISEFCLLGQTLYDEKTNSMPAEKGKETFGDIFLEQDSNLCTIPLKDGSCFQDDFCAEKKLSEAIFSCLPSDNENLVEGNIFNKLISNLLVVDCEKTTSSAPPEENNTTTSSERVDDMEEVNVFENKPIMRSCEEGRSFCRLTKGYMKNSQKELAVESELDENSITGTFEDTKHVIVDMNSSESNCPSLRDPADSECTLNWSSSHDECKSQPVTSNCTFEFLAVRDNPCADKSEVSVGFDVSIADLTCEIHSIGLGADGERGALVAQLPAKTALLVGQEFVAPHLQDNTIFSPVKCCNKKEFEISKLYSSPAKTPEHEQKQRGCGLTATLSSLNLSPCVKSDSSQGKDLSLVVKSVELHSDTSQEYDKEMSLSDLEAMGTQTNFHRVRRYSGSQSESICDGAEMLEKLLNVDSSQETSEVVPEHEPRDCSPAQNSVSSVALSDNETSFCSVQRESNSTKETRIVSKKLYCSSEESIVSDHGNSVSEVNNNHFNPEKSAQDGILTGEHEESRNVAIVRGDGLSLLDAKCLLSGDKKPSLAFHSEITASHEKDLLNKGKESVETDEGNTLGQDSAVCENSLCRSECQGDEFMTRSIDGEKGKCLSSIENDSAFKDVERACAAESIELRNLKKTGEEFSQLVEMDEGMGQGKENASDESVKREILFEKPNLTSTKMQGVLKGADEDSRLSVSEKQESSCSVEVEFDDSSDCDDKLDEEISDFLQQYLEEEKHRKKITTEIPSNELGFDLTKTPVVLNRQADCTGKGHECQMSTDFAFKSQDFPKICLPGYKSGTKVSLTNSKSDAVATEKMVSNEEYTDAKTRGKISLDMLVKTSQFNNQVSTSSEAKDLQDVCNCEELDVLYTEWMAGEPKAGLFQTDPKKYKSFMNWLGGGKNEETVVTARRNSLAAKDCAYLSYKDSELSSDEIRLRLRQKGNNNFETDLSVRPQGGIHNSFSPAKMTAVCKTGFRDAAIATNPNSLDSENLRLGSSDLSTSSGLTKESSTDSHNPFSGIGLLPRSSATVCKSVSSNNCYDRDRRCLKLSNQVEKNGGDLQNNEQSWKSILSSMETPLLNESQLKLLPSSKTVSESRPQTAKEKVIDEWKAHHIERTVIHDTKKAAKIRKRREQPKVVNENIFTFHKVPSLTAKRKLSNGDKLTDSKPPKLRCRGLSGNDQAMEGEKEAAAETQNCKKEFETHAIEIVVKDCPIEEHTCRKRKNDDLEGKSEIEKKRSKTDPCVDMKIPSLNDGLAVETAPIARNRMPSAGMNCISSEDSSVGFNHDLLNCYDVTLNATPIENNIQSPIYLEDFTQTPYLESKLDESLRNADDFFAKTMHKFEPHVLRSKPSASFHKTTTICYKTLKSCSSGTSDGGPSIEVKITAHHPKVDQSSDSECSTSSNDIDVENEIKKILRRKLALERQIKDIKQRLATKKRNKLKRAKLMKKSARLKKTGSRRLKGRSFVITSGMRKGRLALKDISSTVLHHLKNPRNKAKVLEAIKDFEDSKLRVQMQRLLPIGDLPAKDFHEQEWYCHHCSNFSKLKPFSIYVNKCRPAPRS
ncbi:uncharacterized protein LOC135684388 [Rhopilema esculentum]|uniref:uncharacterized protein LOC135684388 n=1 Tax=Rhopilema esculentum TaxID=499914 RepID=UPI0031DB7EB6|eukprot:gene16212-7586_t